MNMERGNDVLVATGDDEMYNLRRSEYDYQRGCSSMLLSKKILLKS